MEAAAVPTLWLRLPVLIFSRKPSDQWSVGGSPQRILPEIKKEKMNPSDRSCPAKKRPWMQHNLFSLRGSSRVQSNYKYSYVATADK